MCDQKSAPPVLFQWRSQPGLSSRPSIPRAHNRFLSWDSFAALACWPLRFAPLWAGQRLCKYHMLVRYMGLVAYTTMLQMSQGHIFQAVFKQWIGRSFTIRILPSLHKKAVSILLKYAEGMMKLTSSWSSACAYLWRTGNSNWLCWRDLSVLQHRGCPFHNLGQAQVGYEWKNATGDCCSCSGILPAQHKQ